MYIMECNYVTLFWYHSRWVICSLVRQLAAGLIPKKYYSRNSSTINPFGTSHQDCCYVLVNYLVYYVDLQEDTCYIRKH